MATPEQNFLYSLLLLAIGAVISFVLGTWLTIRWQNNRKKLDIKVDIVLKMDETIMHQVGKAQLLISQKKIKSPTNYEQMLF
jgi:hypothetical protein